MAEAAPLDETTTVKIPALEMHEGYWASTVTLDWKCPKCGGPRGEPFDTISFDGSRRLHCHGWRNPCGHIDYYNDVRDEARSNGLNACVRAELSV